MKNTTNYSWQIPTPQDAGNIENVSAVFDEIDADLKNVEDKTNEANLKANSLIQNVPNRLSALEQQVGQYDESGTQFTPGEIYKKLEEKQDKLTAGEGITIYGNVISASGGGSGVVDQTYNPESKNAQSGKAVAEAVKDKANLEEVIYFGFLATEIFADDFQEYIGYAVVENVSRVDSVICFEYRKTDIADAPLNTLYLAPDFDASVFNLKYGESVYVDGDGQTVRIIKFKDVADKQDKFAVVTEDENEKTFDFEKQSMVNFQNSKGALRLRGSKIFIQSDYGFNVEGSKIENVATPTQINDATNKKYVDSLVGDIETALDEIKALQDSILGGE